MSRYDVAMNGMIELVAHWLTPTVLFCVLNLTIFTIFVKSKSLKHFLRNPQNLSDDKNEHLPRLVRVPPLFGRVVSFNFSRYRSEQPDPVDYAIPAQEQASDQQDLNDENEEAHHVRRSKSHPTTSSSKKVLKKSASEKVTSSKKEEKEEEVDERRPATVREKSTTSEDEAVDAKADDFINMFRQQLKLQRLDSVLRYKEMLRG